MANVLTSTRSMARIIVYGLAVILSTYSYAYTHTYDHAKILEGKSTYASHRANNAMVPGSVQKVISMYLIWKILGPEYVFTTPLIAVEDNKHYQIAFNFDPNFNDADLQKLLQHLPRKTPIRLDIVSNGLTQPYNPHWPKEDRGYCYAAPLGPAIINHNCGIVNKTVLVPHRTKNKKIQHIKKIQSFQKPLSPYEDMPLRIQHYAQKQHIILQSLRWTMRKQPGKIIASHHSKPVKDIMLPGIKKSHNLTMDALWFATAQKLATEHTITWKKASQLLTHYMIQLHPAIAKNMTISDGSGLSHTNRITAQALNMLLKNIEQQPLLYRWARGAFPVAAHDGTLKKRFGRFKDVFNSYKIVAKTGTLKRARNLCGWVTHKNGQNMRFIWLENAPTTHHLRPPHLTEDAVMADLQRIFPTKKRQT